MTSVHRQQLIEDAQERGVTGLRCVTCGYVHPLIRLGRGCNAASQDVDGETCPEWTLDEVNPGAEASITAGRNGTP